MSKTMVKIPYIKPAAVAIFFLWKRLIILANFTLYFGTYIILLTCSTFLFVYTKYSLSKTIQLYLEKPIRDISLNEVRNARKAIFKGINNGFMDESLNELPQENTQQFP